MAAVCRAPGLAARRGRPTRGLSPRRGPPAPLASATAPSPDSSLRVADTPYIPSPFRAAVDLALVSAVGVAVIWACFVVKAPLDTLVQQLAEKSVPAAELMVYAPVSLLIGAAEYALGMSFAVGRFIELRLRSLVKYLGASQHLAATASELTSVLADVSRASVTYVLVNVLCEAVVPDRHVFQVPFFLAWIAPAGTTLTGNDVEKLLFDITSKVLRTFVVLSLGAFAMRAKRPSELDDKLSPEAGPLARHFLALRGKLTGEWERFAGMSFLIDRALDLAIVVVCAEVTLQIFNVSLQAILAVAGVSAIAVSFAARPFVQSLIGGLVIFLNNLFSPGDHIVCGHVHGYVEHVGWVHTIVTTSDGVEMVPNDHLVNKALVNESRLGPRSPTVTLLRLSPFEPGKDDLLSALKAMQEALESNAIADKHHAKVWLKGSGPNGVLEFAVEFMLSETPTDAQERQRDRALVLAEVYAAAQQHGFAAGIGR